MNKKLNFPYNIVEDVLNYVGDGKSTFYKLTMELDEETIKSRFLQAILSIDDVIIKQAMLYRYRSKLTYEKVGKIVGMSKSGVTGKIEKGRRMLRRPEIIRTICGKEYDQYLDTEESV